jgi:tRNA (guanine37-N1)-methyltransferase
MVIADSITRLIPGVLEKVEATQNESYENGLLEHPHYTRPAEFEGVTVPAVLTSGDHKKIAEWREQTSLEKTKKNRPDLIN